MRNSTEYGSAMGRSRSHSDPEGNDFRSTQVNSGIRPGLTFKNGAVQRKNTMRTAEQSTFLRDELFSMTLMATVQRGRVYRSGTTENARKAFQQELRRQLETITAPYRTKQSEEAHVNNIVALAASLSASHGDILYEGRFRIASAQKALNLFLKYLWCLGDVAEPPHCPFDFQIIKMLPADKRCNWTRLDKEE